MARGRLSNDFGGVNGVRNEFTTEFEPVIPPVTVFYRHSRPWLVLAVGIKFNQERVAAPVSIEILCFPDPRSRLTFLTIVERDLNLPQERNRKPLCALVLDDRWG
jgi:hypothetical protein